MGKSIIFFMVERSKNTSYWVHTHRDKYKIVVILLATIKILDL